MKKLLAIVLAVLSAFSMTAVAYAENTTLTTTVPDATYTLNIPADQDIDYRATSVNIGNVTVTNGANFAESKNVKVVVTYSEFTSKTVSTTIPFSLYTVDSKGNVDVCQSGKAYTFEGKADGSISEKAYNPAFSSAYISDFRVTIAAASWGKALGGDYSATITFSAEVVAED